MASDKREIYPQKKQKRGDRFISDRLYGDEKALQQAKLDRLFDSKPTYYSDELARSLWGATHTDIKKTPIINFSLPKSLKRARLQKNSFSLTNTLTVSSLNMEADYYINPICWGSRVYLGVGTRLAVIEPRVSINSEEFQRWIPTTEHSQLITSIACSENTLAYGIKGGGLRILDETTEQEKGFNGIDTTDNTFYLSSLLPIRDVPGFYMIKRSKTFFGSLMQYDPNSGTYPVNLTFDEQPTGLAFDEPTQTIAVSLGDAIQIWDRRYIDQPRLTLEHLSPTKALLFPRNRSGVLISGGGTNDKQIRQWNLTGGEIDKQVDTQNQITNLHSISYTRFFATEGFTSHRVSCWREGEYELERTNVSKAGQCRVLYSAQNPKDVSQIVTVSPMEKLCFWSVKNKKTTRVPTFSIEQASLLR